MPVGFENSRVLPGCLFPAISRDIRKGLVYIKDMALGIRDADSFQGILKHFFKNFQLANRLDTFFNFPVQFMMDAFQLGHIGIKMSCQPPDFTTGGFFGPDIVDA